jgi:hypothetical protein
MNFYHTNNNNNNILKGISQERIWIITFVLNNSQFTKRISHRNALGEARICGI